MAEQVVEPERGLERDLPKVTNTEAISRDSLSGHLDPQPAPPPTPEVGARQQPPGDSTQHALLPGRPRLCWSIIPALVPNRLPPSAPVSSLRASPEGSYPALALQDPQGTEPLCWPHWPSTRPAPSSGHFGNHLINLPSPLQ